MPALQLGMPKPAGRTLTYVAPPPWPAVLYAGAPSLPSSRLPPCDREMSTCAGTNQDGSSCSNTPAPGSAYCHVHQDQADGSSGPATTGDGLPFLRALALVVSLLFLLSVAVRCEMDHWLF